MQEDVYNNLYKRREYLDIDLPDFKITDREKVVGKKILILGVGTGRDVKYLARTNQILGVDSSKNAVNAARKNGVKAYTADLGKALKLKSNSYDIVIAKDILEHLNNPELLLREIKRVMKDSGYAVISVPNHFFLPFRLRILFGRNLIWKSLGHDHTKLFEEWNYMHKVFFTWKGFQKFLKQGGFKITKTFWDFGTLAHYSQPENVLRYLEQIKDEGLKKTVMLKFGRWSWSLFNLVFPKSLRSRVVAISPGLMCAGFYVWCKKGVK